MRQFKFRVWDKKHELFVSLFTFSKFFGENDFGMDGLGEDCVIQQYTGCLDKNGKEIFEGDIVRHESECFGMLIFEIKFEISYDDAYPGGSGFTVGAPHRTEVIGNIFENPELLTKEQEHEI